MPHFTDGKDKSSSCEVTNASPHCLFIWGTKLVLGHLAAKLTDYSWIPLSSPLYLLKSSFPLPLLRRPKTDLGSKTLPLAS